MTTRSGTVSVEANKNEYNRKRKRIATDNSQNTGTESNPSKSLPKPVKKKVRKSTKILQERMLNEAPDKEFLPNEIILATIPGFVPWPSRILQISGQTITIQFFGTGQV